MKRVKIHIDKNHAKRLFADMDSSKVGCAGARAFCKSGHGFFWLSGEKELCTFINGVPLVVSDEYQVAELSHFNGRPAR